MTDKKLRSGKDSTVQKRAGKTMRESEEQYRKLAESSSDVIFITGRDDTFTYINQSGAKMLGIPVENVIGKNVADVFPPAIASRQQQLGREVYSTAQVVSSEMEIPIRGEPRWFDIHLIPLVGETGGVTAVMGSVRDLTQRKQTEEKLRMSEFDLRTAQALAHVGSWRWDIAHDELVWSDEMYRIYGIARPAFTGSWQDAIARVVHPDDRARVEEANRAVIEDHPPQPLEYRIVRPDGSVRTVLDETGETTLDDKGNVSSLRGVVFDITARKEIEAEKEAMQAQLQQFNRLEAVGQLAGGVAHNFNNLLTGILGSIEMARMDIPPTSPAASSLDMARAAAVKAAGLAQQLLFFGRNAMVLPVVQDANSAVLSALELVCSSLPGSIEVVRDFSPDAWDVLVDSSQLTQVLLELANNAREAMGDKGTITVRTRSVTVDDAYVTTHSFARTGEFVVLSVADMGPGIDPSILPRLFEPFATTRQFGRGMGLPTVFGALRQAGGWVDVMSQPGEGTTFDMYLPRSAGGAAQQ